MKGSFLQLIKVISVLFFFFFFTIKEMMEFSAASQGGCFFLALEYTSLPPSLQD